MTGATGAVAAHSAVAASAADCALWTDFSLGAWTARHAATELAWQLGITLPPRAEANTANIINAGVDREARGDGTMLGAYADARIIAAALPLGATVGFVRPRFGLAMRRENRAFLRYLRGFGVQVRVLRGGGVLPALPPIVQVYPGLIDRKMLPMLGVEEDHPALSMLPSGHVLVAPAARALDPRGNSALADRLSRFERLDPRLFAYCQVLGSSLFVDATQLSAFSLSLVQDSADLALHLALHARACARTLIEQGVAELQLQGIRIFLHRFGEVADAPLPSTRLPDQIRGQLMVMRGWGRLMTGDLEEADRCFAIAQAGATTEAGGANDLYRRNIMALARYRAGDIGGALRIEQEIEATLAAATDPDPQLRFVNAINLARLHRAAGDLAQSSAYLSRAFATSDNVRNIGEILQLNLMQAAAANDDRSAALGRLRAALAWIAAEPPEALSIRAIRTIVDPGATIRPRTLDAHVSRVLDAMLARCWRDVVPLPLEEMPHVALSDAAPDVSVTVSVSSAGLGLLWSPERRVRLERAPATVALAARCFAIVMALTGTTIAPDEGTWVIDCVAGCDVRASAADVAHSAWRHGLSDVAPAIALGPAVRHILDGDETVVTFQRHLPATVLDTDESGIVKAIGAARAIDHRAHRATILSLIERRVLGFAASDA